jgi:uncharacterized protein
MIWDASILVSLIVPEATSDDIFGMIKNVERPLVSDFAFGESCSAISIRVRRNEIGSSEAEKIVSLLDEWIDRNAQRVATESRDIVQASKFVRRFDLGLRMPDAIYLALSRRLDTSLATLDRQQARAATALGLRVITPHQL